MREFLGIVLPLITLTVSGIYLGLSMGLKRSNRFAQSNVLGQITSGLAAAGVVGWLFTILGIGFRRAFRNMGLFLLLAVTLGFLTYFCVRLIRRIKYAKNPVISQIAAICKQENVVALQCMAKGVWLYRGIGDASYCKRDVDLQYASEKEYESRCAEYLTFRDKPAQWNELLVRELYYGALGYGVMDEDALKIFSRVLKRKLHMNCAHHKLTLKAVVSRGGMSVSVNASRGTASVGANIGYVERTVFEDYFLYKSSAKSAAKAAAPAKPAAPKAKGWD